MEIELQVLEKETLALCPKGPGLYQRAHKYLGDLIKPEAYQSMIELTTPVCNDLKEVKEFFSSKLKLLATLAEEEGLVLWAASLHPFSLAEEQKVWGKPRYEKIFSELQMVGRRFIAQGLHIHLGMPDAQTAIIVYNQLRLYLPLLLALSTSSPFYEGQVTGLYSYRSKLFEALPLAGLPRAFASWEEFSFLVEALERLNIIQSIRDLWWDIRLQPTLGTVEVRIYDVPCYFVDLLALVALTQALARYLLEYPLPSLPDEILAYQKWQAARHGLEGRFVDPQTRSVRTYREELILILQRIEPLMKELGLEEYKEPLQNIVTRGTGAEGMLRLYQRGLPFTEIIQTMIQGFWS